MHNVILDMELWIHLKNIFYNQRKRKHEQQTAKFQGNAHTREHAEHTQQRKHRPIRFYT